MEVRLGGGGGGGWAGVWGEGRCVCVGGGEANKDMLQDRTLWEIETARVSIVIFIVLTLKSKRTTTTKK